MEAYEKPEIEVVNIGLEEYLAKNEQSKLREAVDWSMKEPATVGAGHSG